MCKNLDDLMSSVRSVFMPKLNLRGRVELSPTFLIRSEIILKSLQDS